MATLYSTPTFSISTCEELVDEIKTGMIVLRVKVRGFLLDETISGHIRRVRTSLDTFEWRPSIVTTSGGRDRDEVPSELTAFDYYSQALSGLVTYMSNLDIDFEQIYQNHLAELQEEKQRQIDADPAMTEEQAIELLDTITENYPDSYAVISARGTQSQNNLLIVSWDQRTVRAVRSGKGFVYAFDNEKMSREMMLQELMKWSGRVRVVTEGI